MYSHDTIASLHAKLAIIFSGCTTLLGGSYLYGHARQDSDVDFYAIVPLTHFFWRRLYYDQVSGLRREFPGVKFSVLLVPTLFFSRGWYYIYGQDTHKKIHASPINRQHIWRTSLKLSLWHYLDYLTNPVLEKQCGALRKCGQQLAAALAVTAADVTAELRPLFMPSVLAEYLRRSPSPAAALAREMLHDTLTELRPEQLLRPVEDLMAANKPLSSFSLFNYCWYNEWALGRGSAKFLLADPDMSIIAATMAKLKTAKVARADYEGLRQEIFYALII